MPTAGAVAAELRKLVDALAKEPETEISEPSIYFSHYQPNAKDLFLALVKVLPRPLVKNYTGEDGQGDLQLKYSSPAMSINCYIHRSQVCTMVEPAKPAVYKCEPLFSDEDEAAPDFVKPITATVNQPTSEEWSK